MGSKLNILQHFYLKVTKPIFHQIPSNSGNSENGDVSEVSELLESLAFIRELQRAAVPHL